MFKTDSETMALSEGRVGSLLVIKESASVVQICNFGTLLLNELVRAVVEIIAGQIHISVKKGEGTVDTSHPCVGDTVVTAPAAHSASHSTSATHTLHHRTGHIIETTIICIVGIEDDTYLTVVCETSHHGCSLISPVIHVRTCTGNIMSAAAHHISEPAFHHSRPYGEIDYGLFLTVIDSCELSLIRLLLHHLDLIDDLGWNVLGSQLRVIQEEGLAVNGYLLDCLTIGCDASVCFHLYSGEFFQEFLQHVIVGSLEG